MKKIILTSIICAALFLTGCSKHELTYFKFPTNNSYAFILNSSDVITEIKCKTYDSQNTRVVNENEILTVSRDSGKNYCETIENPHRKIQENGKTIFNEDSDALRNIGFMLYTYTGFNNIEYKHMYELDCSKNSEALANKCKSYYIFSKTELDVISGTNPSEFIKNDKKSHIALNRADGKIYLVTDKESTPNFIIIERGEYLAVQTNYNKITVTSPEDELSPEGLINIVIKDFE